jgi:hypothetical protein
MKKAVFGPFSLKNPNFFRYAEMDSRIGFWRENFQNLYVEQVVISPKAMAQVSIQLPKSDS